MYKVISIILLLLSLNSPLVATTLLFQDDFELGVNGSIYATTNFVGEEWSIMNGALSTGSSTLPFDVHYQHYVEIRYLSDQLLTDVSLSFDYMNTRSYGGRLAVIVGQVDELGNSIWMNDTRYINWDVPNVRSRACRITPVNNFIITEEQILQQSLGRDINRIFIRELDITNVRGTGLIDNINIYGTEIVPNPEPNTLLLLGLGILFVARIKTKHYFKKKELYET